MIWGKGRLLHRVYDTRRRRGPFFRDLGKQPGLNRGGRPLLLRMIVGETAGLEDYRAQLGDAAATGVVEVHERKAGSGHRILKQRLVMLRGLAEQADTFVGMELNDPAIDFVGLAHALGVDAHRAKTVQDATDLIGKALSSNTAMLIDVDMERGYRPL